MPLWNFYYFSNSLSSLMSSVSSDKQVMVLYLVPAILYCVSNNVFFLSISYFNPTTYAMFLQIRLLLTGLIYQVRQKTWQNPSVSWLFTLLIIYRKSLRIYKNYPLPISNDIPDSVQESSNWKTMDFPPSPNNGLHGACCRSGSIFCIYHLARDQVTT